MGPIRVLLLLFVVLVMVFATRTAKADDCVGIEDFGSQSCSGAKGCESEYESEYCSFGCVSGTCNGRGSSGECCGKIYYVPNISGGGGDGCSGIECGDGRVHARASHVNLEHRAELLRGYTPGLIMLSVNVSYKAPQLIYSFNRCSHTYEVVMDGGRLAPTGM
jgi:hypothetical protein